MLLSVGIFSFTVFGVFLLSGKGTFLIAGFNTLPRGEKAKYDKLALGKFYGKTILALSASMVFWLLSDILQNNVLFIIGLILFVAVIIFSLLYSNLGDRFKKNRIK
ncbi:DUF3784 domain-containing protein [Sporosarcina sp. Marseille-Q4063]|uniref:DUF3784 domain-containing protein n=1 Tax=Sporosarcina sp. Marseille-Q4063 TaxID=2810514 RepID=UPI001BAFFDD2|nr:DUF3784 domain-containing protein [Sporosarcina sp. Marseille-Q4063]QUW22685.1 DUF3784 domain-containing protein [Sporosarcina sp. Marseille-Q4063]